MADEITITGLTETLAMLAKLDSEVQNKLTKQAVRAGAKIMQDAAVALAPSKSGLTRENIKIKFSSKPSKGLTRAAVGVRAKDFGPAFYAVFVLWGHRAGSRKLGDARKLVPGNDWVRKAAGNAGEASANVMVQTLREGIEALQNG